MAGLLPASREMPAYFIAFPHHQQWRLIPVGAVTDDPRVYAIANRNSGLLPGVETDAPVVITQRWAEDGPQGRQWRLLPM